MKDYKSEIVRYIDLEKDILSKMDVDSINSAIKLLEKTREKEGNIYIFGNGGSASTASHFQGDFNKGVSEKLAKKYRFICLNDNMATIMSIANDIGYEEVFRFQLRDKLKKDDIIIAISGSGNSKNVINAVSYAKEKGNKIIGLTGYNGGILREMSDVSIHVPVNSMQITEDIHLVMDHLMMSILCEVLCGIKHVKGDI